jgi:hypothetical protein
MKFVNDTVKLSDETLEEWKKVRSSSVKPFGFKNASKYLRVWSRYFQALISQAGTWMFTKHFHTSECGIYKSEGGCSIKETGDLVLGDKYCYFDGRGNEKQCQQLADLITTLVLKFDPMQPEKSLCDAAADFIKCPQVSELARHVADSNCGGPFSGDPLSNFFERWHEQDELRDYRRWVLVSYMKSKTDKEVDQLWADQDLGKELLKKLQDKTHGQHYVFCCSPRRDSKGALSFWINTGSSKNKIDGHRSLEEIKKFLKEP